LLILSGQEQVALNGSDVLVMVTLHDVSGDEVVCQVGKMLIPLVSVGAQVDQWFALQVDNVCVSVDMHVGVVVGVGGSVVAC